MHHLAPMKSIPPPDADVSTLDHTDSFDVDVRLSMLPPSEISGAVAIPQSPAVPNVAATPRRRSVRRTSSQAPQAPPRNDPTQRLGALKERLESDPRPRYVVNKDKMDHGPFTAVELLQQIASNTFTADHTLRDEISGQSREIKEWEEFAPFAEQAAAQTRDRRREERGRARRRGREASRRREVDRSASLIVVALVRRRRHLHLQEGRSPKRRRRRRRRQERLRGRPRRQHQGRAPRPARRWRRRRWRRRLELRRSVGARRAEGHDRPERAADPERARPDRSNPLAGPRRRDQRSRRLRRAEQHEGHREGRRCRTGTSSA